jgi:hypothetical protein
LHLQTLVTLHSVAGTAFDEKLLLGTCARIQGDTLYTKTFAAALVSPGETAV